jgi:hypothetical protein
MSSENLTCKGVKTVTIPLFQMGFNVQLEHMFTQLYTYVLWKSYMEKIYFQTDSLE